MGFWTECINPYNKPLHSFYSDGQVYAYAKLCPVCWRLSGHKDMSTAPGRLEWNDRMVESKPEKDSL